MLSPCTFVDIFNSRNSNLAAQKLLQADGALFLSRDIGHSFSDCKNVWVIDGDDTLWEDNIHYEALASELANHVVACVGADQIQVKEVRQLLDDVEHEIIPIHGFGPLGFDLSMRECLSRINARYGNSVEEPSDLFARTIPLLSGVPYEVDPKITDALTALRARGDGVVLFTQGPNEIQQGKIARSGLAPLFHCLAVGSNKKEETYQELFTRCGIKVDQAIVVGNSLRSEVEPALRVGARAVHYLNPNSWHVVNQSSVDQNRYKQVGHLLELIDL